jgi:NADPH:quinone reductase-like Zn-dependent oxidoreductase
MCENEAVNGVTRDGGYGEYVLLRTEAVVRVPRDVDPVECTYPGTLFFLFGSVSRGVSFETSLPPNRFLLRHVLGATTPNLHRSNC